MENVNKRLENPPPAQKSDTFVKSPAPTKVDPSKENQTKNKLPHLFKTCENSKIPLEKRKMIQIFTRRPKS